MRAIELLEGARSTVVSPKKLLMNRHKIEVALQQLQRGVEIYRGMNGLGPEILYTDPTSGPPRRSLNTANYYTLLMDHLPSWEKYPKRSHSLICTTDFHYANGYGQCYVVLPIGDPLIGVASDGDFWWSFPILRHHTHLVSLSAFNSLLGVAAREYGVGNDGKLSQTSYNMLARQLAAIGSRRLQDKRDSIEKLFKPTNDLLKNINIWLDPEKNRISLVPLSQVPFNRDRELWFSAPSYLVPITDEYAKLRNKLGISR